MLHTESKYYFDNLMQKNPDCNTLAMELRLFGI